MDEKITDQYRPGKALLEVNELIFKLVCLHCPEQWEVFHEGSIVGFIRLRHGDLTVHYPDVYGNLVYHDNDMPFFESDLDREELFDLVADLLKAHMGVSSDSDATGFKS